jgi:sulfite reductase (ferredoxin)
MRIFDFIVITILASNVQAHVDHTSDAQLGNNVVDSFVEDLFDRALEPSPIRHVDADLDGTTLGKPAQLAAPKSVSPGLAVWKSSPAQAYDRVRPLRKAAETEVAEAPIFDDLSPGQIYGPTRPAHEWPKPWTNLVKQEKVQVVKARSQQLMEPLKTEMANDEIFVTDDAVHILKHHGSYMQQNRMLKGAAKKESYQFMLRLKVPCGEFPGPLYLKLDELADKYGQGDLRATTRQAFQLHGVLKGNLKQVVADIAKMGSGTLGGCGDISRNVMTPPVTLKNVPAYEYCQQYARAISVLFEPMSEAFSQLWLDGEKVTETEYWKRDIGHFNLDKLRHEDRGNGIISGHPVEPIYGRTYLPKKFKVGMTVPGDNGIDIYTNDLGAVVIMGADNKTLEGFNIMVGGGMGRTHGNAKTTPFAAAHLGYVPKEEFFEAMKAVVAALRDHGNREVRNQARLKYLVNTLGIDDFRLLVEKYFGQKFESWRELPAWKYIDWMGWHEQGDGTWMLGVNIESGRVRDTETAKIKTALKTVIAEFPGVDLSLTPAQSVVFRNIKPEDKDAVEGMLKGFGLKMIEDIDQMTRNSIACPAFPLCGLAITEAERAQPEINARMMALLKKMGLGESSFVMRTTGCPNGCARPYMAELAFVGSGPNAYQVWLGGHPAQAGRVAFESHLKKMKLTDLETSLEPVLAMFKQERTSKDEAFGDFCYRKGHDAIEKFASSYTPGAEAVAVEHSAAKSPYYAGM